MAEAMPTQHDYARAREALSAAHDELDSVCFTFTRNLGEDLDEIPNPSLDPTLADVGALYSFLTDVRDQVRDLARHEARLAAFLEHLDGVRLDLEAQRRLTRGRVAQYCGAT